MGLNNNRLLISFQVFLLFILATGPNDLTALEVLSIEEGNEFYGLIPHLEVLVDETKQLTLQDVLSKEFSIVSDDPAKSYLNEFSLFNMGFASSAYWFKFQLSNKSNQDQLLLALKGYPHAFKSISLFVIQPDDQVHRSITGAEFPFSHREIKNRNFIIPLPLIEEDTSTVYLRIDTDVMMIFNLFLTSPLSFYERDHREQMLMGMFTGIIIAMILYNLFLFISTREKSLLYYVFFLISTELYHLALSGQGYEFVWSSFPRFNYYAVLITSWLATAMFANFVNHYLQLSRYAPVIKRINTFLLTVFIGFALLTPFINVFFNDRAVKLAITITFFTSLWACVAAYKRGFKQAVYFGMSWGLFCIGAIILILSTYQLLPLNIVTDSSFRIGLIIGVILLSFGMADRINALEKEKRLAQQEALKNKQLAFDYLQKSKDRIKQILNHAIEGIFQFSKDKKLVFVNPAMSDLFRYQSPEEMMREVDSIETLWDLPENQEPRINQAFLNKETLEFESKLFRQDGSTFWGMVSVRSVQDRNNSDVYAEGMVLDITDRKQKIHAEQQKKAAEEASQLKSVLLANISHELKTPLHGVLAFSSLGLRKLGKTKLEETIGGKLKGYFESIQSSGYRLLKLLNDILDLSKIEAGKVEYNFAESDLSDQILIAAAEVSSLLREKNIAIDYEPPIQAVRLPMDSDKIVRVVLNLLTNAIKFSPPDSSIEVDLAQENECVTVNVKDRGVGIPDDELESVFNRYTQSSKTKAIPGGTGLGLAISREIILAHKGNIWASNNSDQGATFSFQIPFN